MWIETGNEWMFTDVPYSYFERVLGKKVTYPFHLTYMRDELKERMGDSESEEEQDGSQDDYSDGDESDESENENHSHGRHEEEQRSAGSAGDEEENGVMEGDGNKRNGNIAKETPVQIKSEAMRSGVAKKAPE